MLYDCNPNEIYGVPLKAGGRPELLRSESARRPELLQSESAHRRKSPQAEPVLATAQTGRARNFSNQNRPDSRNFSHQNLLGFLLLLLLSLRERRVGSAGKHLEVNDLQ